jgi:flavin-dependent dehydrogenase
MGDATVIGGGPAGSSAAIRLARAGLHVKLYEKTLFPRPKLCGGYLSPECHSELDDLHVLGDLKKSGIYPIRRMVIASCQGTVIESPLPEETFAISRDVLDTLLLSQAKREGVQVLEGFEGFTDSSAGGITVIASGRLPRGNSDFIEKPLSPWYAGSEVVYAGIQAFFQDVDLVSDQIELDLVESGYVGLVRTRNGVNVCALTTMDTLRQRGPSLDATLRHFMGENPVLHKHLNGAKRISPWQAVAPVRFGIRQLTADHTFYTGDAACVLDPFAGEGMAMAIYSSKLLVKALNQTRIPSEVSYRTLWHKAFDSAIRWNAVMRMAYGLRIFREPLLHSIQLYPIVMNWLNDLTRYRRLEGIG